MRFLAGQSVHFSRPAMAYPLLQGYNVETAVVGTSLRTHVLKNFEAMNDNWYRIMKRKSLYPIFKNWIKFSTAVLHSICSLSRMPRGRWKEGRPCPAAWKTWVLVNFPAKTTRWPLLMHAHTYEYYFIVSLLPPLTCAMLPNISRKFKYSARLCQSLPSIVLKKLTP